MSATFLARSVVRGGYGAVLKKQLVCKPLVAARPFSVASKLHEKLYAKSHEWIEYSADKKQADTIGDIVYVELPEVGNEIGLEDSFGSVESVKSASDLYSPIVGKVIEANSQLEAEPKLINKDPENGAWIAKFEITAEDTTDLMSADEYKAFTDEIDDDH